ncbi:SurA N-terminal domain-containing protein [Pseudoduganella aquatica]|uniref:Periplasmic chaperone PpiD n=1 Tax=Pseudoduganella aquatica TaxID=2660641 RepID=A0A7X4KPE9_9BURK|nr:SurA N-terminal domain-containing protein [Pseudoduganella aquatica]MYN09146.1 peptidylprolyl isomerase [Pseudoduganella aquatica]
MFEFIRTHQKLMQILLALLIVPSFVFVGVAGYNNSGDQANIVAKVGDQSISRQEWESAQRSQLDSLRQRMGAQFDQKLIDTPEFKQNVLERLVAERAIAAEMVRSHLTVADSVLQKQNLENPALRKEDGSFDMERYKALLAAQGLSPAAYDAQRRREMSMQQLLGAVQETGIVPRAVAKQISDFGAQEREVQEQLFPAAQYLAQVKVTDEMVKAFYDKNSKLFEVPEQAKIEYVVFSAAAVADQVTVSDAEVAAYYEANKARFSSAESRRASHILVTVGKDASAADKAAAKAKAEAILADVKKNPADFAKIAKAKSQDPSSAEQGGDLNELEKGSLPKALEDKAFSMKQGEIAGPVETEFGYHVITITALKPVATKPLDEVKDSIAADLKKQKAGKQYSEMAESFTNTVYEQSDSLKPAADKLKLKVETAEHITRNPSPALGTAPYNNAKFLTALFSSESLKNKRNTEAVEVAPATLVAGRIVEFKPAAKRPLAEVDAAIRQRVTAEEAVKLAHKEGEAKMAAAKASGSAEGYGPAQIVSRADGKGLSPVVLAEVMKADTSKLPAYVGVDVPGAGYGVYRIGKVQQPAAQDEARRKSEQEQITSIVAEQEMAAYIDAIKQKSKVKILAKAETAKTDEAK